MWQYKDFDNVEYNENLNLMEIVLSCFTSYEHLAWVSPKIWHHMLINTKMTRKHSKLCKSSIHNIKQWPQFCRFVTLISVFVITHINVRFDYFKSILWHQFSNKRLGYIFIKGPIHAKLWSDIIRRHSHNCYEIPKICLTNFKCLIILLFSILHTGI